MSSPFELVYSAIWGPCRVFDVSGFRYFVTFVDNFSRMTGLFLLKDHPKIFHCFRLLYLEVLTQYNIYVKYLLSDNAREYLATTSLFQPFLDSHGIIHQTFCSYTPQQDGVAECKNRHLLDVVRCLMFHMSLPKHFWGHAVLTMCYLTNRLPTSALQVETLFSILHPNCSFFSIPLRVSGFVCFVHSLTPRS